MCHHPQTPDNKGYLRQYSCGSQHCLLHYQGDAHPINDEYDGEAIKVPDTTKQWKTVAQLSAYQMEFAPLGALDDKHV